MKRMIKIFRKELKDTLRDRRTIVFMIVIPLVLIPLLFVGGIKFRLILAEKEKTKELRIAYVGKEFSPKLYALFEAEEKIYLINEFPLDSIAPSISNEEIDGAVAVAHTFSGMVSQDRQGSVSIYFKSSKVFGQTKQKIEKVIKSYNDALVSERIKRLNLDENLFDAISITEVDVASTQETIGKLAGGLLPYMFILFCFMGAMYPGIDLGAGEKERGTLETLLSTPASRLQIVLGKLGVVSLAAIISALVAIGGLYFTATQIPEIPEEVLTTILEMLGPKMIILILTLVIPIAVFFAATILALSIYAKSFKEAQSIITPFNIIIIIPVAIGMMPGIELDAKTALIPVLNVSLASKDVLAGTIDPFHLTLVYLSLFFLASVSIFFCVKWFNREETLFRT